MAYLEGTLGNDSLVGTNYIDSIYGDLGNDTISGGFGDDFLDGEEGGDSVLGGAGADFIWGDDGNDTLAGGNGNDQIYGGAGSDTAVFSESNSGLYILLYDPSAYDPENGVTFRSDSGMREDTLGSIENVIGTPNDDVIFTSIEPNKIDGAAGNDWVFYNFAGFYVSSVTGADAGFSITWQADGSIRVSNRIAGFETDIDILVNVERVGDSLGNDAITGNAGNNDFLVAGGKDTVNGGGGTDRLFFNADSVSVNLGQGWADLNSDGRRETSISAIEDVYGTGGSDLLVGSDLGNRLVANAGEDTLDGREGIDTLEGGAGNDTYYVGAGDVITEIDAEGTDVVFSNTDWTLTAHLESLTLIGEAAKGFGNSASNYVSGNAYSNELQGGGGADTLLGLNGNDTLSGDSGNDVLDGGLGADTLVGGAGDDNYSIDELDSVSERADEGVDTVRAWGSYTLSSNLENLVLEGTAPGNGGGNELANVITGNASTNVLDGGAGNDTLRGGAGSNTLIGGVGDDTFVISSPGNTVSELAGEGIDTVRATVSYTLGVHEENLILEGSASISARGNQLANVITGNPSANVLDGGAGADILRGGAGDDIYVVEDTGDVVYEVTGSGLDTVRASVSYTLSANVEDLFLEGMEATHADGNALANFIVGNLANNVLDGGAGPDTLSGGSGADTLIGGSGDDTYLVSDEGEVIEEKVNSGIDTVHASVSYSLGSNVENLSLSGSDWIDASGNELANTIIGNSGNNLLDGGGGADTLRGGAGDDTYTVSGAGDIVSEGVNSGVDTVRSSVSYTLGPNVENLLLEGSTSTKATGNALGNTLTGNSGSNLLEGGAGADTLWGGPGTNTLRGGGGDDTYIVTDASDVVSERTSAGFDVVRAWVSYTLSSNVERLVLEGIDSVAASGNVLANVIVGNSGDNVLDAGAGADTLWGGGGADTLLGGSGNDTYLITGSGEVVSERFDAGVDTVRAWVSYTLSSNVENLLLEGADSTDAGGNALANLITGNAGNNVLDGGAGADTLRGGAGDDIYMVTGTGDVVSEGTEAGVDTVQSLVSYTLASNFENLVLAGNASAGTGNLTANTITGNSSGNILEGRAGEDSLFGGQGPDTLVGGEGRDIIYLGIDTDNDIFLFRALTDSGPGDKGDIVYDFVSGEDQVDLRQIDANDRLVGNQAFDLSDGPAAHALWWVVGGAGLTVVGDVNGDAISDFEFQLEGVSSVGPADFIL